ncbi:hypothetical protein ScPMuIL_001346 [Solemya velum]
MEGKIALVTGSTSGIGLGISRLLAERGCSIVISGFGDEKVINSIIEDFKRKYRCRVDFLPVDLRYPESIQSFCEAVTLVHPEGVDILVNNAGIQYVASVEDYPTSKWNEMISVGLTAPFLLVKYFLPFMRTKGWGRIINMSSQMGIISAPGKSAYSTVKAGLIGFTKGVALETAVHGVTSNAVCPGYAEAPILLKQVEKLAQESNQAFDTTLEQFAMSMHPTEQLVKIDEIAEMVLYLCSPAAKNVTGSALVIDGGNTSR